MAPPPRGSRALQAALLVAAAAALDNGFRVPAMGFSTWYGFTSNIDEVMLRGIADGLVSSGLRDVGYNNLWIDDGYVLPRDNATGRVTVDPAVFPSGIKAFADYVHARGLKFGVYTSIGPLTCLGTQPTQPKRPGSCGYETVDAQSYLEWGVDQVKDDGCGSCPQHDPYVAMRDALNATGRPIFFSIHGGTTPGSPNGTVANDWRTGGDLYSSSFDMWTNRLDLATTPEQAALVGPGSFANPDFLEVGYSPRAPKGADGVMSALEQRSMFTMWAALPTPLILSADVRPNATSGGVDDAETRETLMNAEVIAVNQDEAAQPMRIVFNSSDNGAAQVWRKPLASAGALAVVLFHRGADTTGPLPDPPAVREISVTWEQLGLPDGALVSVRDLWAHAELGVFSAGFAQNVSQRDAKIFVFTPSQAPQWTVLPGIRCHNDVFTVGPVSSLEVCEASCASRGPLVTFCTDAPDAGCPGPAGSCWCYPLSELPSCAPQDGWISAYLPPPPPPPPTPYDYVAPGAFADNLCSLSLRDAAGQDYVFDLRGVATVNGSAGGISAVPCGVFPLECALVPIPQPLGAGVQLSGPWSCFFPLSSGPPLHALADASNAASGGLVTTFQAAWRQTSDGEECHDFDPVRGRDAGRRLVISHACDATAAPGAVKFLGSVEDPVCTYTLSISSLAACGTKAAAPAPAPNPPTPAAPAWAPNAGPFAAYLCNPVLSDAGGGKWRFAFQQLFSRGSDYSVTTPLGTFALNVCGYTQTTCTPAYAVAANFGALVVQWAGGAPPGPAAACTWGNGTAAACTAPCRTLAEGAPVFSLANASNGATGGVVMALQGELVSADEPASTPRCGFDASGDPLFPHVTVRIACDASVPTLKVDGVQATADADACAYVVMARASAACGAASADGAAA